MLIDFSQGGLKLVFEVDEEKRVLLKHFSCKEQKEGLIKQGCAYAIGDIHVTGENQSNHHGGKHTGHSGERTLRYVSHRILPREGGRTLEILLTDGKMNVTCHYEAYHGIAAVRAWVTVENISKEEIGLEYVPAFTYTGLCEGLEFHLGAQVVAAVAQYCTPYNLNLSTLVCILIVCHQQIGRAHV